MEYGTATYIIVAGDHGMGMSKKSEHAASTVSSWKPYMNFYGPGNKEREINSICGIS